MERLFYIDDDEARRIDEAEDGASISPELDGGEDDDRTYDERLAEGFGMLDMDGDGDGAGEEDEVEENQGRFHIAEDV